MFRFFIFCILFSVCLGQIQTVDGDAIEALLGSGRNKDRNRGTNRWQPTITQATIGQVPSHVLIIYEDIQTKTYFACSGSIVHSEYVLTSAKCIQNIPEDLDIFVYAEIIKANGLSATGVQKFTVNQRIPHPEYDNTNGGRSDIALLKIDTAISPSANIGIAQLPSAQNSKKGNSPTAYNLKRAMASGWGLNPGFLLVNTATTVNNLMVTNTTVMAHVGCRIQSKIQHQVAITSSQLCTRPYRLSRNNNLNNNCYIDLGSPLFAEDKDGNQVQIGVASYGTTTCRDNPTIFTFVGVYGDWIRSSMI